jgi:hypothetical protein
MVVIDPPAPTDRALQCVGLVLRSTITWTPHTFTTSVCRGNTGSIGARERAGGRTEGREELLLVIEGRADVVDQVVADGLRAERTPSRLFWVVAYNFLGFFFCLFRNRVYAEN